jgi:threonine dehydratase
MATVTVADVYAARERIRPFVRHTPLEASAELSEMVGANVSLKLESMQFAGSFKPRVSFSKLLALDPEIRARGVVASTAGGHGMGLSYAGHRLGIPVSIYLPHSADPAKVSFMRRHGAELNFHDSVERARGAAQQAARESSRTFVSAYNDPHVVAGGGTVALEILEDAPATDLIVVGMGGGGLASGMAIALKAANPKAQVWGVQPSNNPVLLEWMRHGRPVPVEERSSIADGLGAYIEEDSITFPLAMRLVDHGITVSDDEIRAAMVWLFQTHNLVAEPSGAAPIAALRKARTAGFRNITLVITGRNIAHARWMSLVGGLLREASSSTPELAASNN